MPNVILAVSYDTEHAIPAALPPATISPEVYQRLPAEEQKRLWTSYLQNIWDDPKLLNNSVRELQMLAALAKLFRRYDGGFTSFVLGRWLDFVGERMPVDQLRGYFADVAEIGSHSYDHVTFQTSGDATRQQLSPLVSAPGLQLRKANESIERWLGVRPVGFRTPMGNVQPFGKADREVLEGIRSNGLRYVSSWLKAAPQEWNRPGEVQPFFYTSEGYPQIAEIPGVGAYDVHFVQPTKLLVFNEEGSEYVVKGDRMENYYIRLLESALRTSKQTGNRVFVPLVFHPHATVIYDPELQMHESLLRFCKSEGIAIKTYRDILDLMQ